MKIWIDILNPSQVHFFKNILPELKNNKLQLTSANFLETTQLLQNFKIKNNIIGDHPPKKGLYKNIKMLERLLKLSFRVKYFDISLSFQNIYVPMITNIRKKKNITLLDNTLPFYFFRDYKRIFKKIINFNYIIIPDAIPFEHIKNFITNSTKIYRFKGYKENISVSNYVPNENFLKQIPFNEYVVVRPEALFAAYVMNKQTIVPKLVASLSEEGYNVIYLPRSYEDLKYVKEIKVYIPKKPLNGLDLCWFSQAVLTGSGTFAREAACLGVPAVSFFPEKLLSVDKQLINERKLFHSRNIEEILEYINKFKSKNRYKSFEFSRVNSTKIKNQVIKLINEILNDI